MNVAQHEANAPVVDLDTLPEMEVVKETEDLEIEDADTSHETSGSEGDLNTQPDKNTPHRSRAFRRTRGLSLLPIKPLEESPISTVSSPPKTPSPLKLIAVSDSECAHSPASGANTSLPHRSPLVGTTPNRSIDSSINSLSTSSVASKKNGGAGFVVPSVDDNQQLLNAYFSQLASKEALIGNLRANIASLQKELKEAEADMSEFKRNGTKLAQLVNDQHDFNLIRPRPTHNSDQISNHRQTTGNPRAYSTSSGSEDAQKDVLGMGRRVVGEINSQFWAFLDDVKSATIGNSDFEHQAGIRTDGAPKLPPRRSPSPRRQLNAKKSIQDFMRARSPTRFRSNSPTRQERREHAANQDLRSSERLSRKLSHIDLRAPSTSNRPSPPPRPRGRSLGGNSSTSS